jgi:ppGpp synthetase/RelA/SpoT-type nucleotidyltranferase
MKKTIPREFLNEYESKRQQLQDALEQITSLLRTRLGQLVCREGVRGNIAGARVKRPVKLWRNAARDGLSISEAFSVVEDLLGVRIVCNNLSDIAPLVQMIRTDCSILSVLDIKDMISSPLNSGYRATHVRTELLDLFAPCEIQIRTLAQDAWARLSRADLYGKDVPQSIQRLARALSTQLSAIDEIAQLIRDELNQCPEKASHIKDSDYISPQRLALLYKNQFGDEVYEWTLIEWVRTLEEAEIEKIGDVRALLNDVDMRKKIDKLSNRIRGFLLEDLEWAVYSAVVAGEITTTAGIKAVKKRIQEEWDEIAATAWREALSSMPDTFEEFVEMLQSGYFPQDAIAELGGIQSCYLCGRTILRPEQAAEAAFEYYGNPDVDVGLETLFEEASGVHGPEVESVDFSGACQYCGYQMSKDD